jgi:MFS transporter, FSR family, fosmidomycin resistance protein
MVSLLRRRATPLAAFVLTLLAIEWLDEVVYSLREASWPLIRQDLGLSYVQIGLILSLPIIIANLIEPAIGILGDVWKRRVLILAGGVSFTIALLVAGTSHSFIVFLLAEILSAPSSGAFVSLSQASLMDYQPERHEQNMARWTLVGSIGVVTGPLLLGVTLALGGTWRTAFLSLALVMLTLVLLARRLPLKNGHEAAEETVGFRQGIKNALAALKRRDVLRWLILLEFSNLMLDILLGYLALYFVDVVHVSETEAGIAVAVWTGIGLLGDALLIPLLERVRGLSYLWVSAALELALFPAFLLAQPIWLKLVFLGLLGFFNSGWYSILQGQLYSAMPGQSGTVMAVSNVTGLLNSLFPFVIGLLADRFGLSAAMWFMLLGPIALLVGLPRRTGTNS